MRKSAHDLQWLFRNRLLVALVRVEEPPAAGRNGSARAVQQPADADGAGVPEGVSDPGGDLPADSFRLRGLLVAAGVLPPQGSEGRGVSGKRSMPSGTSGGGVRVGGERGNLGSGGGGGRRASPYQSKSGALQESAKKRGEARLGRPEDLGRLIWKYTRSRVEVRRGSFGSMVGHLTKTGRARDGPRRNPDLGKAPADGPPARGPRGERRASALRQMPRGLSSPAPRCEAAITWSCLASPRRSAQRRVLLQPVGKKFVQTRRNEQRLLLGLSTSRNESPSRDRINCDTVGCG
jgi:hypothetical protein